MCHLDLPRSFLLKTTVGGFRISELQSQLEEAHNELEKLRESRHHQVQLVESIVRQRDMFRILLAQTTGAIIPLQGELHLSAPMKRYKIVLLLRVFSNGAVMVLVTSPNLLVSFYPYWKTY